MSNSAQAVEASSAEEEPSAEEDTPSSLDGGAVERLSKGAPSWLSERRLKFTADHAVGHAVEEVVLVKRSIEPEVADVALRI